MHPLIDAGAHRSPLSTAPRGLGADLPDVHSCGNWQADGLFLCGWSHSRHGTAVGAAAARGSNSTDGCGITPGDQQLALTPLREPTSRVPGATISPASKDIIQKPWKHESVALITANLTPRNKYI